MKIFLYSCYTVSIICLIIQVVFSTRPKPPKRVYHHDIEWIETSVPSYHDEKTGIYFGAEYDLTPIYKGAYYINENGDKCYD